VKILLKEGVNIKTKALDGSNVLTALTSNFSHRRHVDFFPVLRLLIEFGADPDAQDANGRNCLLILCAEYTGNDLIDIVRFLVEKGKINTSSKNKNGRKAIDFLLNRGFSQKSEVVQLLL
jgi:ankyrin repeat protein